MNRFQITPGMNLFNGGCETTIQLMKLKEQGWSSSSFALEGRKEESGLTQGRCTQFYQMIFYISFVQGQSRFYLHECFPLFYNPHIDVIISRKSLGVSNYFKPVFYL